MLIFCGTAVINKLISTENAVITILKAEAQIGGLNYFLLCAYSGCWDMLIELLNATISPQDFLLWYKNLIIENALRGLKIKVE